MTDTVCIIGAGSSGIVAAKVLKAAGIPFDCFEMGSGIGGNWRYNNDNGRSSAYRSLHIDTSKERMAYSDFPMPAEYPNFPHHSQILAYFEAYVDHFGVRERITFRTRVERVEPAGDHQWAVTIRRLADDRVETRRYRAVLVCNGHHWQPRLPDFPGSFDGETTHSHYYREPFPYRDKNVLVVGIGNSGTDLACEISHVARRTFLASRRSAHIIPRYILGRPTDKWNTELASRLPFRLQRALYRLLLYLGVGNQENYGVPRPDHPLLSEHPTMSADLLTLVSLGQVVLKPNVRALRGDRVDFVDNSTAAVDAIIYATGYRVSFPFLDDAILPVDDNRVGLYHKVVHPTRPGLYFIGLIQPLGAIMPLAELQAHWVARLLRGESRLPSVGAMQRAIARDQARLARRYVDSPRHTIQVDFYPYKRQLLRAMG